MDISAKNLSFSYGGKKVIDSLDLELVPGKLTFLLGANGSGKSTLLKLLSGLLKPESGSVMLGEKELHTLMLSYRSKHLGVMLQQHGPALDFTAEEFVMFGRTSKLPRLSGPGDADKEAVKNALELLRMESFSGRPANRLSGGEFQRLCIASVLALESEILFFDEPVSAQDPAQAAMIFETLKELAKEKNILIISHDLDLAARCGERILLLADGKIFADGTPEEVLNSENLEHLYQLPGYTAIESRSFGFCRRN